MQISRSLISVAKVNFLMKQMHMEKCICCITQILPFDLNGYSTHLLCCDVFMGKRKLLQR